MSGTIGILLLVSVLVPSPVFAQAFPEPLRASEQNPVYRLLYVPRPAAADVVGDGRWRLAFSTEYSSVFEEGSAATHYQVVDLERMTTALSARRGLGEAWEVGGELTLVTQWDGFLDGFVMGFHDLLGIPNGGREDHPKDRYLFELEHFDPESTDSERSVVALDLHRRTFGREDLKLFGKWRFQGGPDEASSMSLRATARIAGEPLDPGRLSGGITAGGRFTRERTHVHLQLGVSILNPPSELRPIARDYAFFYSHGVEHRLDSGISLLGQLTASSPYFRGVQGSDLHGVPMILTLGVDGRAATDWRWRLAFSEDILFGGPSVDFTIGLEISRALGGRETVGASVPRGSADGAAAPGGSAS